MSDAAPLAGLRVLVTRLPAQAEPFAAALRARGADVHCVPSLALGPPSDRAPLDAALARGGGAAADWLVFTSANAVSAWADACAAAGVPPAAVRVAATGEATAAAARRRGLRVDLVPERYVAEDLAAALIEAGVEGAEVLLPRAETAREVLPDALRAAGAVVHVVPVYATHTAIEGQRALAELAGAMDALTFFSSKTASSFVAQAGDLAAWRDVPAVSVGPITSQTLRDAGFTRMVEARISSAEGVLEALEALAAERRSC